MTVPDPVRQREAYRHHLKRRLEHCQVPHNLHTDLIEYLAARRPTGDFLRAMLTNDLRQACQRADMVSRFHLFEVVLFLTQYAPPVAWGSAAKVDAWLQDPEEPPLVFA